jgi:hypothetical protein
MAGVRSEVFGGSFGRTVRSANCFSLDDKLVARCLDLEEKPGDRLFHRAWKESLSGLSRVERAALAPTTGHVAESVAEIVLGKLGYQVIGHQSGPGGHGIDLLVMCPEGSRLVAVEVKGTLQPRRWPRLRRGELAQMSPRWLDKPDNPGMLDWDLTSEDVYGAVLLISFSQRAFRLLFTDDFVRLRPVMDSAALSDLSWLDEHHDRTD